MAGISITEVAFSGLRAVRENPKAALFWAGFQLVFGVISGGALVTLFGPLMGRLSTAGPTTSDPARSLALLAQAAPFMLFTALLSLIYYSVVMVTMTRLVLRPGDDRLGYLRFGADELRQALLLVLSMLVFLAMYFASAVILGILMVAIAPMGAALTPGAASPTLTGVAIGALMGLAVIAAFVAIGVRLSLAAPLTFATGKVNLFGSWKLTRGSFWPLLGAYGLVLVITGVIAAAVVTILNLVVTLAGGDLGAMMMRPDASSLAAYLTPPRLLKFVASSITAALLWPLWFTPAATAYRRLAAGAGVGREAVSSVFS